MNAKLIAYAMDAASFIMQKTKLREDIKNIILFGSVARGEAGKESDIDLFVDIISKKKEGEEDIKKCLEAFMASTKYKNYWKLLNIKNEIKVTVGDIQEWGGLQSSIIANGITLYGKYMPVTKKGVHKTIFAWENIKPNAKRVLFNKRLFGYRQNKKFYEGLLQKYSGERLGKGCVIVTLEHASKMHEFFRKYRITVKIKKFMEY